MDGMFAGTFDLFTIEHEYIARTAAKMFDELYILIADNPGKRPMFKDKERVEITRLSLDSVDNVTILSSGGLVFDVAKGLGVEMLVRGLRYTTEYEYELRLATGNLLVGGIPTVGIFPRTLSVSSSDVRLLMRHGSDKWKMYVNKNVIPYVSDILERKDAWRSR